MNNQQLGTQGPQGSLSPDRGAAESDPLEQISLSGPRGEEARARVIGELYGWIERRCQQIVKNDADAVDAAQEVAMTLHRSLPDFEGRSSLRTWVASIVYNECVDNLRRGQRHALSPAVAASMEIHQRNLWEARTLEPQHKNAVHDALGALPVLEREVLHLRFFAELPIAEIGTLLGLSLSATKMRLYRALGSFKDAYAEIHEDLTFGTVESRGV